MEEDERHARLVWVSDNIARILGYPVADVFESMATSRPYRHALGLDKALEEIEQHSGELYDKEVVMKLLLASRLVQSTVTKGYICIAPKLTQATPSIT